MHTPEHTSARSGLAGARIVLGVTGGIAAYKAAELVSALVQQGAAVQVVMTEGATRFIQPLTFEGLTHQRVYTSVFEGWDDGKTGHVELAAEADLLLIAPATANTIARLSLGLVDDMLSAVALATQAPMLIAPAMEHHMWNHSATQANVATLRERGVQFVGPAEGRLASGAVGQGRLAPLGDLLAAARQVLGARGPLAGKRVVITAGGTQEALDPVRYLGNRSSGRMGLALAEAAIDLGADVHVIATRSVNPLWLGPDAEVVETALDLELAVHRAIPTADILIMAAAVADFRPESAGTQKIKKQPGQETLDLHLVRNPDIIAGVNQPGLVKIGFAAETEHLLDHASEKLRAKGLDMIVANDAVATIGATDSSATVLRPGLEPHPVGPGSKELVAREIMADVVSIVQGRANDA